MKLKNKVISKIASAIRRAKLGNHYIIKKDGRENSLFKLVFFSGERDLDYLNASLISVYKVWEKIPEIYIISDGTPLHKIKNGLINWPQKINIISWEECAISYKERGNLNLHIYATNELIGKKLVGILHCAEKFPVLYSDSDVLWFNSPTESNVEYGLKPQIKMSHDVGYFYTKPIVESLGEGKCLKSQPFNSGVMYLNGEFSIFPKWDLLCEFLGKHKNFDWFSEQTSFAILNNHFNPHCFFKPDEILIKIDDEFSLKYTKIAYPKILARHYVSVKGTAFWRDFVFILFSKKTNQRK